MGRAFLFEAFFREGLVCDSDGDVQTYTSACCLAYEHLLEPLLVRTVLRNPSNAVLLPT